MLKLPTVPELAGGTSRFPVNPSTDPLARTELPAHEREVAA